MASFPNTSFKVKIAPFEKRIVARAIDFSIIYFLTLVCADIVTFIHFSMPLPLNYLFWSFLLLYEFIFLFLYQRTLGKMVMGLSIVSLLDKPLMLNQIILRVVSMAIPFEFFLGLFTRYQQCLHDLVAKTVVVEVLD